MNYRRRDLDRPRNKYVAAIMALFFGAFGVHKFYLREVGGGIFYVMLMMMSSGAFKIPISGILGIIDAIRLFTMSDQEFNFRYNKGIAIPQKNASRPISTPVKSTSRPVLNRSNPYLKSGIKKYKQYDIDGAIIDFNKALDINPNDPAIHFNLACAYSLNEKKELGFRHLSRAVDLGFKDFNKILTHDDLAFLRIQKEFDKFKDSGYKNWDVDPKEASKIKEDNNNSQTDDVLLSQLNRLVELRKKGILNEAEFELERKKLLRN